MPFLLVKRGVFGALPSCGVVSILSALLFVCTGSVSDPSVAVVSDHDAELVLECRSGGWFPEPELLWLDAEGKLLSAGPTETVRGSDDLYTVSSRVTVDKRHSSRYTCRVQQTSCSHYREAHLTMKHVSLLDPPDLPCAILITLLPLLGGSLAACFWWNRRRSPAEQLQINVVPFGRKNVLPVKPNKSEGEQRFIQKNHTGFSAASQSKDEQQFSP
ncbi:putative butyrophilin subfamily 2 member A3 [Betta splendens]|uniref:Butyrophilin subfamily 2 member A3 n=1 Tax=Betta splendens TaxID=158456 RepID=A0A9W2Y890_BETSP|nr:putative butyrophilin subfamily 2 member A3 [Betta splendens]